MTLPVMVFLFAMSGWAVQVNPPVNADALIQKEFVDRVQKYVELRKQVEARLPALPEKAEPEELTFHQQGLLRAIQAARREAKQGEIFRDDSRHLIRRLIAGAISQHHGPTVRQAMREENPGMLPLRVNQAFPTSAPLPTVPPQVLLALPRLPDDGLEYRFVGRRLLLLDSRANMVVDYMDRALPS